MGSDTPLSVTAREILAYLTAQPEAEDTVDGIVQWWSSQATVRYDRMVIEKALAELAGEGMVTEIHAPGSSPVPTRPNKERELRHRYSVREL